ncbi:MAG: sensor histidine kinase RegB [Brevirhabdus sp.]
MSETDRQLLSLSARSGWIRLRTLIVIRWLALAGQLASIYVGVELLDLTLNISLCLLAIGISASANLVGMFAFPESKRLSDDQAMVVLFFDILQLGFLLYMTGGLNNPFALLMLAPVTISATALRPRSTIFLGTSAVVLITVLLFSHVPLETITGDKLELEPLFLVGFWLAIVIGITFEGAYAWRVTSEIHSMSQALLATQMALGREQKLTDLGGVVAAAAHELGTPLATIKLVSSELAEELDEKSVLREDAELIRTQADRCRDILRSMGQAGKDDLHLRHVPLSALIQEAAAPHAERGTTILYNISPSHGAGPRQPSVRRQPEIIHGLRNFVQNAVDFSNAYVWIDAHWDDSQIVVRVIDDGPGYPPNLLGRLGDPFLRRRRSEAERAQRPEYEGMGLGLFIAKTLLERSGGTVRFANGSDPFLIRDERGTRSGAIAEVVWTRADIALEPGSEKSALGENQPIGV